MRILIIVNNHNSFTLFTLCDLLSKKISDLKINYITNSTFYFKYSNVFVDKGIKPIIIENNKKLLGNKKKIRNEVEISRYNKSHYSNFYKLIKRIFKFNINILKNSSIYLLLREFYITIKMNKYKQKAFEIFKNKKFDLVLSINDRGYTYDEAPFLWAAKKLNIPIILPFAAQFDISKAQEYRKDSNGEVRPFFSANTYPSIYKTYAKRCLKDHIINNIFFQNLFALMSAKNTGILSSNSWWPGNGICDAVFVDSKYTKELYIKNKVEEEKIYIVGHPDYDLIFESLKNKAEIRRRFLDEFHLDEKLPYVLLAVPQYYEQGDMEKEKHWKLIESYIQSLKSININLLLSLHPRMIYEDYEFLQKKYNCNIVDQKLCSFIGCADLFLATNSTTLNWSIMCDIPTVAIYGHTHFYDYLKSIHTEEDPAKLGKLVFKLLKRNKPNNPKDFEILSREDVFFGKSMNLHLEALFEVINKKLKNQR